MFAIYEISTGKIVAQQSQSFTPDGHESYWVGDARPDVRERFYISGGQLMDRPAQLTFPATGIAPLSIDLSQIVPGSTLTIYNSDDEQLVVQVFSEPLTLTGADKYVIELAQPFPARNAYARVEVTNA